MLIGESGTDEIQHTLTKKKSPFFAANFFTCLPIGFGLTVPPGVCLRLTQPLYMDI